MDKADEETRRLFDCDAKDVSMHIHKILQPVLWIKKGPTVVFDDGYQGLLVKAWCRYKYCSVSLDDQYGKDMFLLLDKCSDNTIALELFAHKVALAILEKAQSGM